MNYIVVAIGKEFGLVTPITELFYLYDDNTTKSRQFSYQEAHYRVTIRSKGGIINEIIFINQK
jgi:hypothetical protein